MIFLIFSIIAALLDTGGLVVATLVMVNLSQTRQPLTWFRVFTAMQTFLNCLVSLSAFINVIAPATGGGKQFYLTNCDNPEEFHKSIYYLIFRLTFSNNYAAASMQFCITNFVIYFQSNVSKFHWKNIKIYQILILVAIFLNAFFIGRVAYNADVHLKRIDNYSCVLVSDDQETMSKMVVYLALVMLVNIFIAGVLLYNLRCQLLRCNNEKLIKRYTYSAAAVLVSLIIGFLNLITIRASILSDSLNFLFEPAYAFLPITNSLLCYTSAVFYVVNTSSVRNLFLVDIIAFFANVIKKPSCEVVRIFALAVTRHPLAVGWKFQYQRFLEEVVSAPNPIWNGSQVVQIPSSIRESLNIPNLVEEPETELETESEATTEQDLSKPSHNFEGNRYRPPIVLL